jgi:hypothetical protein
MPGALTSASVVLPSGEAVTASAIATPTWSGRCAVAVVLQRFFSLPTDQACALLLAPVGRATVAGGDHVAGILA